MPEEIIKKIGSNTLQVLDYGERTPHAVWFELKDAEGSTLALLRGEIYSDIFKPDYHLKEGLPTRTKVRITKAIHGFAEEYLRKKGVAIISRRTNIKFGRFLVRGMGYEKVGEHGTSMDVDKNIAERTKQKTVMRKKTLPQRQRRI